jgi:OmpA-OmpF porin, OOP family
MKKCTLLTVAILYLFITSADAQVLKRLADRAKQKLENKAGDKVDKEIDETVDGKKKKKTTDTDKSDQEEKDANTTSESSGGEEEVASSDKPVKLQAYSKYDFVPGDKVVAYEDFSKTDIGDFPERWNTNATGEVVTINSKPGKWLKINKEGIFHPEFITSLPENFTLEFDLGVNNGWNSYPIHLNIAYLPTPEEYQRYGHYVQYNGNHNVHLNIKPAIDDRYAGNSKLLIAKDGNYTVNNDVTFKTFDGQKKNFGHVSVWRQKQRLRVYLNGEKLWDIPRAFDNETQYNAITFAMQGWYKEDDYYLLSNIRLALGAPDTRNKLITEGKFVTRGILFDVNSDVIKPESYGALKDIANVLKENADVKVNIIGHTDADGDDKANLELSKRRASAVKKALSGEFGIEESRMQTDGKGESAPVDKNDNVLGKANNRRVEFVKL